MVTTPHESCVASPEFLDACERLLAFPALCSPELTTDQALELLETLRRGFTAAAPNGIRGSFTIRGEADMNGKYEPWQVEFQCATLQDLLVQHGGNVMFSATDYDYNATLCVALAKEGILCELLNQVSDGAEDYLGMAELLAEGGLSPSDPCLRINDQWRMFEHVWDCEDEQRVSDEQRMRHWLRELRDIYISECVDDEQ